MKTLVVSLLLFATPAFAKTKIMVECDCTYGQDYIEQTIRSRGYDSNAQDDVVAGCLIEKGKVLEGCWTAKMNAQYNCQKKAASLTGSASIRPPHVTLVEASCTGSMTEE